jgi:hypothetical protein
MVETTLAGSTLHSMTNVPYVGELFDVGNDLLESEALLELLYQTFLPLIVKGWTNGERGTPNLSVQDLAAAYRYGFYIPCCARTVLAGQMDLKNDMLPDYAGVVTFGNETTPTFASVRKDKLPRGFFLPPGATGYAFTFMYKDDFANRETRRVGDDLLHGSTSYIGIKSDGTAIRAIHPDHCMNGRYASIGFAALKFAMIALNLETDSRYLWTVRTQECLVGEVATPLRLGVSESHVKSLFYARSLPVTETGRKRPILHWVQAHQRRLREGIEIDIKEHLRGIDAFDMAGFSFEITNPRKQPLKRNSTRA